jgi:hypothetical protein
MSGYPPVDWSEHRGASRIVLSVGAQFSIHSRDGGSAASIADLSAFGPKRASGKPVGCVGMARLTPSGHSASFFVAMHVTDRVQVLLYSGP